MRKGISEIATAALYIGISVTAISAALTVGAPAIDNMRDAAAISQAQTFMQDLDSNVQQVVSEGMGSTRTVSINLQRGRMFFENDTNALVYELETNADVISPQSSTRSGNVVLSSSANVEVYNKSNGDGKEPTSYSGPDCYMMENEHIRACIKQVANVSDFDPINTTYLLTHYEFKDDSKQLNGNLTVKLDGIDSTSYGRGYTQVERYGTYVGTGRVKAHVASDYGYTYDVIIALPTGADFLKVDVQNIE